MHEANGSSCREQGILAGLSSCATLSSEHQLCSTWQELIQLAPSASSSRRMKWIPAGQRLREGSTRGWLCSELLGDRKEQGPCWISQAVTAALSFHKLQSISLVISDCREGVTTLILPQKSNCHTSSFILTFAIL